MRSIERLKAWIERARDAGVVAIDTMAASLDPMQAELCGFSLAVAPNEACYVPLGHRQGGEGAGLFSGDIAPDQIAEARRSMRSSRCSPTWACSRSATI